MLINKIHTQHTQREGLLFSFVFSTTIAKDLFQFIKLVSQKMSNSQE